MPWVTWVNEPPANPRRRAPDGVVIHAMGEFIELGDKDLLAWEYLVTIGLSAHAFVSPSGVIVRQVPDMKVASHARGYNSRLGIEVCVPGIHTLSTLYDAMTTDWVSSSAFAATVEQTKAWLDEYDLDLDVVDPHSDLDPRKRDPGSGFPWQDFLRALR